MQLHQENPRAVRMLAAAAAYLAVIVAESPDGVADDVDSAFSLISTVPGAWLLVALIAAASAYLVTMRAYRRSERTRRGACEERRTVYH